MTPINIANAEVVRVWSDPFGVTQSHRQIIVPAGTKVRVPSSDWTITVTQAGIDCDCGKGVLCPLNPQEKL